MDDDDDVSTVEQPQRQYDRVAAASQPPLSPPLSLEDAFAQSSIACIVLFSASISVNSERMS